MLRLLGFLIVAAALMFGGAWLFNNDNALQIQWFDGEIYDWSLAWLIIAAIVLVVLAIVVYELLRLILGFPARWWVKRKQTRYVDGLRTVTRGMMAVAAGDVTHSKELRREAEKLLGEREPAALLLAAQSAELADDHEVAQLKYRQMLRQKPTALLGLRGLLNDAIATGDQEQALELARRAYRDHPYTEWVVETLFELLVQERSWSEAYRRIDDLKLNKIIDGQEAQRRRSIIRHLMAEERAAEGETADAFKIALDATKRQRSFAPAAVLASELAMKQGKQPTARSVLEEAWARAPHPALLEAFKGLAAEEPAASRLSRLERLYSRNGSHHLTLRAMIEAALAAGQVDRAIGFARQVPAANPTVGTLQAAIDAYRAKDPSASEIAELEGLLADAPLDEAWVCERTGHAVERWQPFGPEGDFDSLRWQSPPRVATFVAAAPSGTFTGPAVDLEPEARGAA